MIYRERERERERERVRTKARKRGLEIAFVGERAYELLKRKPEKR